MILESLDANGNGSEEPPDSDEFYIARAEEALGRKNYSLAAESYLSIAERSLYHSDSMSLRKTSTFMTLASECFFKDVELNGGGDRELRSAQTLRMIAKCCRKGAEELEGKCCGNEFGR